MVCNSGEVDASCPKGWYSYLSNYYYVSEEAFNWEDARSACETMNSDLVSISDEGENEFVHSISLVQPLSKYIVTWYSKAIARYRTLRHWCPSVPKRGAIHFGTSTSAPVPKCLIAEVSYDKTLRHRIEKKSRTSDRFSKDHNIYHMITIRLS